ncbi:MAG: hypothetical protein WKF87_13170 [Chryseolinea sp.]
MENIITPPSPHPGIVAIVFALLFNTGLSFVISFTGPPYYPGPWESATTIAEYFRNNGDDAVMCAFFQIGASIPLMILTGTFVVRLRANGANAAGTYFALLGGIMTAINLSLSALTLWVLGTLANDIDQGTIRMLYYLCFAVGGVGYSMPMGLLIAGIAVTSWFSKSLPKSVVVIGLGIAIIGALSWLSLIFPKLLFLIPLTRFPAFIWLIGAGFVVVTRTKSQAR